VEHSFDFLFLDVEVFFVAFTEGVLGSLLEFVVLVEGCGPFWGGGGEVGELCFGLYRFVVGKGNFLLEGSREVRSLRGGGWRLFDVLEELFL